MELNMKQQCLKVLKKGVAVLCSAMLLPSHVNGQSLEEAVASTLDTHPGLRAAYTRFKVNEQQVEQAESAYWPTIDALAGIGYEYTDSPSTRNTDADTADLIRREIGLSLKQELFSGFHTRSEVARTNYATSAELWRLYGAAEDLALEVSKVYIELIKAMKLVKLSEINLSSHEDIYEQIKERTYSGLGSTADLSQINARLAGAKSNLIAAKNNFLDAKVMFFRVVEQPPENLATPYPDAMYLPDNKDSGLQIALENHPVIKAGANDVQAALAQHNSAGASYYPKVWVDVNANFNDNLDGENGDSGDVGGENNEILAMLRVSYNLFSGGRDSAYAKETAHKMNEAKELNRTVHRDVSQGFLLSWNAFEQLNLQKKYIKMNVIASKHTQMDYKQQFTLGQRSLLDLLDTENELYEARRDYLNAEFSEISAQYRILHAMGLLVDALRVTRPSSWLALTPSNNGKK